MNYFKASPDEFDVVFTANATAAIKLVADCFRDQNFDYIYHKDVHTSVVGVRELSASTSKCLASNEEVEHWINLQKSKTTSKLQLFAYPAQSNLNGYRPPYSWCRGIKDACWSSKSVQSTYVLLDAASYLTSGRLDLASADDAPDFIALSFYKIFGFPDLGALLIKKTAYDVMTHRHYFGGGTIDTVTVLGGAFHGRKQQNLHDFLEDGTLPFHNIVALNHAITVHERMYRSAKDISQHVAGLIAWLYNELKVLEHSNGASVVDIYEDPFARFGDASTQGPIIAFNILRSDGSFIAKSHLERLAIDCGFQIRTGGVCNPGGVATMLKLSHWELMRNFTEGVRCGSDVDVVGAKPTGICRVSLGPMSTMSDVVRFAEFIKLFFVEKTDQNSVQKTVLSHKSVKIVTPIDGCSGSAIGDQDFDAYSLWDKQWCIVESTTDEVVQSRTALGCLSVSIDVKSEKLRITHTSGDEITLSLWDVPKAREHADQQPNGNSFNLYEDNAIDNWLLHHLGFACSLGRYRHESLSQTKEASTCIVSTCSNEIASKEKMNEHYSMHAKEFMRAHSFTSGQMSKTFDKVVQKLQSKQLPNKSSKHTISGTPIIKSNHSTLSLFTTSISNFSHLKLRTRTSVSTVELSLATSESSRPTTADTAQDMHVGHTVKKTRAKNHTFAGIVTKLTGKG